MTASIVLVSAILAASAAPASMPSDAERTPRRAMMRAPRCYNRRDTSVPNAPRGGGGVLALAVPPPISPHVSGASYLAVSAAATYLGLAAALDSPGGSLSVDPSCFEMRQSRVKGAGMGLFAAVDMEEGTELGTYPGVVKSASSYMKKFRRYPNTCVYAWRFGDSLGYIDPTDSLGRIQNFCRGGNDDIMGSVFLHENLLSFRGVPTLLARINEPPASIGGKRKGACNVITREDLKKRTVPFFLSRDVIAGEELFLDYGPTYDRSGY